MTGATEESLRSCHARDPAQDFATLSNGSAVCLNAIDAGRQYLASRPSFREKAIGVVSTISVGNSPEGVAVGEQGVWVTVNTRGDG